MKVGYPPMLDVRIIEEADWVEVYVDGEELYDGPPLGGKELAAILEYLSIDVTVASTPDED